MEARTMENGVRIAAIALVCLAAIFNVVGLATDYWIQIGNDHGGLWRVCPSGTCIDLTGKDVNSKFKQ